MGWRWTWRGQGADMVPTLPLSTETVVPVGADMVDGVNWAFGAKSLSEEPVDVSQGTSHTGPSSTLSTMDTLDRLYSRSFFMDRASKLVSVHHVHGSGSRHRLDELHRRQARIVAVHIGGHD